ncbi:hypothetical protein ABZ777_32390 [Micromonospora parva]|uniref:hypothetical protein n=1 Tax=Micromonospora parva TaxID=1464048 RepID=UPI0033FD5038
MSAIDRIDGGTNTARLSAAEQDRFFREERQDKARRFLLGRDLNDIAEILGLIPPTTPAGKRPTRQRTPGGTR